jgi:hypothetical protein
MHLLRMCACPGRRRQESLPCALWVLCSIYLGVYECIETDMYTGMPLLNLELCSNIYTCNLVCTLALPSICLWAVPGSGSENTVQNPNKINMGSPFWGGISPHRMARRWVPPSGGGYPQAYPSVRYLCVWVSILQGKFIIFCVYTWYYTSCYPSTNSG